MRNLMGRMFPVSQRSFNNVSSKTLISRSQLLPSAKNPKPMYNCLFQARSYISEIRKSTFEGHIFLRNEKQYASEYAPPQENLIHFCGRTTWRAVDEEIKIEVTMFDGSVPAPKNGDDDNDEVQHHISLIVDISKGGARDVLEFVCSAWPDSLVIEKVFMLKCSGGSAAPYIGPDFKDLDDAFQDALQQFLQVRGVTDELAEFVHEYMINKDKMELIRWMGRVKSFIEL